MYTPEEIDKKILEFREQTKDKGLLLHNNYFIFTVDRDGNVCNEAYGANLMTDYGIRQLYIESWSMQGYSNWLFYTKFGTGYDPANGKVPKLTNSSLYEFACKDNGNTSSITTIESGYYNDRTTMSADEGVIYQTARFQYSQLDYVINLAAQTSVDAGHIGGLSTASPRDTRWKTDEDGNYFEINEIGLTYHDDQNGSNLFFHFAVLDKDGNPVPIRKYDNQKLYVYIYHTGIMPEKTMFDAWDRGEYITVEPINRTYSRYNGSRTLRSYFTSVERDTYSWYSHPYTITERKNSSDYASISSAYPDASFNAETHILTETHQVPERLIERDDFYISGFLLTNAGYYCYDYQNNRGSQWLNFVTYDRQSVPETIISDNFYTNGYGSSYFNMQFGQSARRNVWKRYLLPIDRLIDVQSLKMFNIQDDDFTIDEEVEYQQYYFNQRFLNQRSMLYQIICPDGVKRNIWYYPNIFANGYGNHAHGFAHHMNIAAFTNTGITLFACDKPWDVSTWTQINDIQNPDPALVKKRYFVSYNDVTLYVDFQLSQYPKIVTKDSYRELDDGTHINGDSFDMHYKPIYNDKHEVLYLGNRLTFFDDTTLDYIGTYSLNSGYYTYRSDATRSSYLEPWHTTTGTYGDWFWFKYRNKGVKLIHIPSFKTNPDHDFSAIYSSTISNNTDIYVDTNDSNLVLVENAASPYGFYVINLSKTPTQLGITNNDTVDPTDIAATSYGDYRNYKHWYTKSFIQRPSGDKTIFPVIMWNNGNKSTCFRVYEYDENDTLLSKSAWFKKEYTFQNANATKYKLDFAYDGNKANGDTNAVDDYQDYAAYNGAKSLRIIEHSKYTTDIDDARHAFFIRGTNKVCFTYASADYLTKWYVVDATDMYDSNNNLKILNTFEIDSSFAQEYGGAVGFSHCAYVRLKNSNNVYGTYFFDLTTGEMTYLTDWNFDWSQSVNERSYQFYGDNRCLVFGISDLDTRSYGRGDERDIYCITPDRPTELLDITSKIYGDNPDYSLYSGNYVCFSGFNVRYINDNKQLIFSIYGMNGTRDNYCYLFTFDLGDFIHKRGHTVAAPNYRYKFDSYDYNYNAFWFGMPVHKGILMFSNGVVFGNRTNSFIYEPIENFVPHKIELTTDCITSYNQPIKLSDKQFRLKTTNDMTYFKLENSGKHPKRTD